MIGFIPFPRVLVLCEMQSVSSRIRTRVAVSISYDDNHYTSGTSKLHHGYLQISIYLSIYLCYVLTFWPGQKCHSRWCTGRKWHILMAVMRGNHVGRNWLMKWDKIKNSLGTRQSDAPEESVPLNCMTVISAWWRLNIRFQRSSGRRTII